MANIFKKAWNGIKNAASWVGDTVSSVAGGAAQLVGGALSGIPGLEGFGGSISSMSTSNRQDVLNQRMIGNAQEFSRAERLAQQEYNTSERIAAQNWNEEMWNKQNAYNTPAHMLQLMQEAGINPNTAVSMLGGNTAGAPAASAPQSSSSGPGIYNSVPMPLDPVMSAVNVRKAIADTKLAESEANKTDAEAQYIPLVNDQNIKESVARVNNLVSRQVLNEEQANQIRTLLPLLKNKTNKEIEEIGSLIDINTKKLSAIEQDIATSKSEEQRNRAETQKIQLRNKFEKDLQAKGLSLDAGMAMALLKSGLGDYSLGSAISEVTSGVKDAVDNIVQSAPFWLQRGHIWAQKMFGYAYPGSWFNPNYLDKRKDVNKGN